MTQIIHPGDRLGVDTVIPITRFTAKGQTLTTLAQPARHALAFGFLTRAGVSVEIYSLHTETERIFGTGHVPVQDPPVPLFSTVCYRYSHRANGRTVLGYTPLLPLMEHSTIRIPPPGNFKFSTSPLLGQLHPQGPLVHIPVGLITHLPSPFADFPPQDFQRVFTHFCFKGDLCPGIPRPQGDQPLPLCLYNIHSYSRAITPEVFHDINYQPLFDHLASDDSCDSEGSESDRDLVVT